ncbi:MAG TPA: TIGR00341 family protein [Saprospiraceae bacterium]|nr:TIGR00341 family protein [Saprospiraceae bacterium]
MDSNQPIEENKTIGQKADNWINAIQKWLQDLVDLEKGLDREGTIIAIKSNKRMRGANAWLLICSIMIASLGLDLDSGAVIIGAMLISPLMAPILGVGLSVAINDREALGISLQHFTLAIILALISSTLYFAITPFGDLTPQIKSRTEPNLLDGLVAVFGGLAGIISTSRKEKSSAIPGVAIATALMPPLCVTGYGLANQNWTIALNSFYLFFLNSFFIAMTAFLLIRYMKFEMHTYEDKREARRTRTILILFSLLLVLPSVYILYNVYQKRQDIATIETFIEEYINQDPAQRKCSDYTFLRGDSTHTLVLEVFGKDIPNDSIPLFEEILKEEGLKNTNLRIIQESDLDLEKVRNMDNKLANLGSVVNQLEIAQNEKSAQQLLIEGLVQKVDSLQYRSVPFEKIGQEAKTVFPDIVELSFGRMQRSDFNNQVQQVPVWLIDWDRRKSTNAVLRDEKKLKDFLKVRAQLDTVILIRY